MIEKEPFQLDYERYAINQSLKKIAKKYALKNVLEVPAAGVKAMPSLYSLGFAEAECEVTLVNPEKKGLDAWKDLHLEVKEIKTEKLSELPLEDNSFDLVWNFNTLSLEKNYEETLKEWIRVSKTYIMILCVSGYNVGSPIHRTLHKINNVEWTHGNKLFLYPRKVRALMEKNNLEIVETNVMNCPLWPDTVGFRDMKFHKMKKPMEIIEWDVPTLEYMKKKEYPFWIKAMYAFESIPVPLFLKYSYAHLFYVIGKKK